MGHILHLSPSSERLRRERECREGRKCKNVEGRMSVCMSVLGILCLSLRVGGMVVVSHETLPNCEDILNVTLSQEWD